MRKSNEPIRIHVTYSCSHDGVMLQPIVEKFFNAYDIKEKFCLCTGEQVAMKVTTQEMK